jgi:type II secretory pathway component PulJ
MRASKAQQGGASLLAMLFWGVLLAFVGVLAARVLPTVMEYYTIQHALDRIAKANPTTVPAVRAEFERIKQIEYSIQSISSQDLVITKENDRLLISFAYDKQVDLAGPVSLLIKYQGQTH